MEFAFDVKDPWAGKQHDRQDDDLEYGVEAYKSPHFWCNDIFVAAVRHPLEQFVLRRLCCKGESSESIHDQIDPEHLDGSER